MAIERTPCKVVNGGITHPVEGRTFDYVGRVLAVRLSTETRNMSDTLDYTDFMTVECRYALVYRGQVATESIYIRNAGRYIEKGAAIPPLLQFAEVSIDNHFAWRGCDLYGAAVVDCDPANGVGDAEMLAAWPAYEDAKAIDDAERAEAARIAEIARVEAAKAEEDRKAKLPRVGAVVRVVKGRKVKVGTEGDCMGIYDGQWGRRVGIRMLNGDVVYTAETNVETVLGAVKPACYFHEECKADRKMAECCLAYTVIGK